MSEKDPASLTPDELREAVAVEVMGWKARQVRVRGSTNTVTVFNPHPSLSDGVWEAETLKAYGQPPDYPNDISVALSALDRATEMVAKAGGPKGKPAWNRVESRTDRAGFIAEIMGSESKVVQGGVTRAEAAARAALAAVRELREKGAGK